MPETLATREANLRGRLADQLGYTPPDARDEKRALEGDVHQPVAHHYTYGTDLDYVLDQLNAVDPVEPESDNPTDTDSAVHRALNYVRAEITRRKAVQAGPRPVDYCGLDGDQGRACGPDLGLPPCAHHARMAVPRPDAGRQASR